MKIYFELIYAARQNIGYIAMRTGLLTLSLVPCIEFSTILLTYLLFYTRVWLNPLKCRASDGYIYKVVNAIQV